jgi:tetratricopeptide (TPR) repeat protein
MKKQFAGLFFFLTAAGLSYAQAALPGTAAASPLIYEGVTQESLVPETAELKDFYYNVITDGGSADAADLIKELELRFNTYNRLFRFDPSALSAPLKVRAFKNKADYDAYVKARLGKTRDGAVYLHYNQNERRELVINRGSGEEERLLSHQSFIQFLRAFIPNPPAWLREGFAIYFSPLRYNRETGQLSYEENLAWLETVKSLGENAPSPEAVFMADSRGIPEHFQPLAWSLVSFFLNNGNEDYFRTLTELFMSLSSTATAQANAETVFRRITLFNDPDTLKKEYHSYLASRRTFGELIREGRQAYAAKDAVTAELCFLSAMDQKPTHYAPYYYLGLLAYEEKSYDQADTYYRTALRYGADDALVHYALGLNAASAGRRADAIDYLSRAAVTAPERYKQRVEDLIARLR